MITKEESQEAFDRLSTLRIARIGNAATGLFLQPLDFGQRLHVSTLVYRGDKFIPLSVRKAAKVPLEGRASIVTWLVVDEDLFQITLHYVGEFSDLTVDELHQIASEFEETALRWRQIFEEKDREDLVHVPHQTK